MRLSNRNFGAILNGLLLFQGGFSARITAQPATRFDQASAVNVLFRSDRFPFVRHDVPAFRSFTGFHPGYHHAGDMAGKINYAKMTRISKLSYLTTWRFDAAAVSPPYVPNAGMEKSK